MFSPADDRTKSHRKVAVVTGATSGLGRAVAIGLARAGVHVALLGRDEHKASAILDRLDSGAGRVFRVDLSDASDVRRVAGQLRTAYPAIDVLVNNAGARFTDFGTNRAGIERTFATNHLGHFLLTTLVLEQLLQSQAARVITIGSSAHVLSPPRDWLLSRETYDRKAAYGQSKLANIVFAYELARRLRGTGVTSNALDPGGVATNLGRNNGLLPWVRHLAFYAAKRQLRTPTSAASDVVRLAMSDEYKEISGKYFFKGRAVSSAPSSYDTGLGRELWALSVRLSGVDQTLGAAWRYVDPAFATNSPE